MKVAGRDKSDRTGMIDPICIGVNPLVELRRNA